MLLRGNTYRSICWLGMASHGGPWEAVKGKEKTVGCAEVRSASLYH